MASKLAIVFAISTLAFSATKGKLSFKDFAVTEQYRGPLHAPELDESAPPQSPMNWSITNAASLPPDFAGHYRVVKSSCGTECTAYAVTNVVTERLVFEDSADFPYEVGFTARPKLPHGLEYHVDSGLFVVHGCLLNESCGSYYYVVEGDELRLKSVVEFKPQPARIH